jgi:osmoprotectant transport system substrate-binding protein
MKKSLIFLTITLCLMLIVSSMGTFAQEKKINVGAKDFTEQYVIGHIMSILLEENGFEVKEQFGTGSTVTRQALVSGQTDLYPEYTGTASLVYLKHEEVITEPDVLYEKVKKEDLEKNGIVWLERSDINNTYAIAITKEQAEEKGITTLSDLAEYVNQNQDLIWAIDHEFAERADGLPGLAEHYGIDIPEDNIKIMEIGLTYEALDRGQADIMMVFATDGKIKKYDLQILEDDKNFFPVYNICVTVREEVLDQYPEIEEIMKPIAELTDEIMQELNYQVDSTGLPERLVAKNYLTENGYLD